MMIMTETDRQVFDDNYLLCGLPKEAKDTIAQMCVLSDLEEGDLLFGEGDKASDLAVMLRGTVGVFRGREKLAEVKPGAVIGELALVDDQPRSADVRALSQVTYARLDGPKLRKFMFQNRDVGFIMLANLARVVTARARGLIGQVEDLKGQARDPWIKD